MVPSSIYNNSSLTILSLGGNQLHGSIPNNLGLSLPYLQLLELSRNQFIGAIPTSLTSISELERLVLSNNNLGETFQPISESSSTFSFFLWILISQETRAIGVPILTGIISFLVFKPKLDAHTDEMNECDAPVSNKTLIPVDKRIMIPSRTV